MDDHNNATDAAPKRWSKAESGNQMASDTTETVFQLYVAKNPITVRAAAMKKGTMASLTRY